MIKKIKNYFYYNIFCKKKIIPKNLDSYLNNENKKITFIHYKKITIKDLMMNPNLN